MRMQKSDNLLSAPKHNPYGNPNQNKVLESIDNSREQSMSSYQTNKLGSQVGSHIAVYDALVL